jgi:hypothetical protein
MIGGRLTELIRKYVTSAEGYGRAIETGNAEESNKCFDEIESAFKDLRLQGRSGLEAISSLLQSESDGVKLWAVAHLLNYPEFNSLPILEHLRGSPSILALTAEATLDQWKNGQINY